VSTSARATWQTAKAASISKPTNHGLTLSKPLQVSQHPRLLDQSFLEQQGDDCSPEKGVATRADGKVEIVRR
jgi:hypothetical protein